MHKFTRILMILVIALAGATVVISNAYAKGHSAKQAKHSVKKKSKKVVAKNKAGKKSKKMSEKERKALATRQVEKARKIARAREMEEKRRAYSHQTPEPSTAEAIEAPVEISAPAETAAPDTPDRQISADEEATVASAEETNELKYTNVEPDEGTDFSDTKDGSDSAFDDSGEF